MVHMLVRKHRTGVSESDLADIAGEGYLGVIQAALKYNPSKGKFR
jgi:DNA-directed RNA polymerase sigma subunit (sigma70/sigma32)